jgi:hypothetical protein
MFKFPKEKKNMIKKLYELPRDTIIRLDNQLFLFKKIDGMYSICIDTKGLTIHIACYTDVEVVNENDGSWLVDLDYTCSSCGLKWAGVDDCIINDKCPQCDAETVPEVLQVIVPI